MLSENISVPSFNTSQPGAVTTMSGNITAKAFKTFAYVIILVISITGNSFLIMAFRRNVTGQMRSVYNLIIVSIGVSDLLLAMWSIPERITRVLTEDAWLVEGALGVTLCKVVNFAEKTSIMVSFLHLGVMSLDRFLVVFYPWRAMVSTKSSKITIASIWVFTISFWAPIFYFGGLRTKKDVLRCEVRKFTPNWQYWYLPYVVLLLFNMLVILVLYFLITCKLWLRIIPGNQTIMTNKLVDRAKRRMARMIAVIVTAFYVCFVPYWIGWISCSYIKPMPKAICNPVYKYISTLMLYTNCAINPVVCLIFNQLYRIEGTFALRDPLGLRVNEMRLMYKRRKSSSTVNGHLPLVTNLQKQRPRRDTQLIIPGP